jgi:hypothetical protein
LLVSESVLVQNDHEWFDCLVSESESEYYRWSNVRVRRDDGDGGSPLRFSRAFFGVPKAWNDSLCFVSRLPLLFESNGCDLELLQCLGAGFATVCMYVYTYVCMYVSLLLQKNGRNFELLRCLGAEFATVCMYVCMYVCVCACAVFATVCMFLCLYVCVYVCESSSSSEKWP